MDRIRKITRRFPLGIKIIVLTNILLVIFYILLGLRSFRHASDWFSPVIVFLVGVPAISSWGLLQKRKWAYGAMMIFYGAVFTAFTVMSWYMHYKVAQDQPHYYIMHVREILGEGMFAGYLLWGILYLWKERRSFDGLESWNRTPGSGLSKTCLTL